MTKKRERLLRQELRALRTALEQCDDMGAWSLPQAAKKLGISQRALAELIATGAVLARRVLGEMMVPKSEVRRRLERRVR